MDLSIIIVNYKSKDKLANCLRSLVSADLSGIEYETVIVENASGDDLSDLLSLYPQVRLINSPANLGMGGGNNIGIRETSGAYILVANPDIVFTPDSIKQIYEYIKVTPEAAIVGPKLLNPNGSLQYSCARFPNFFLPVLRRTRLGRYLPSVIDHYLMKSTNHNEIKAVDWIMGACFVLRRDELFIEGKLFDERFFMYFEDVDLCRRARAAGKSTIYYPEAIVTHDHQRDSARLPWYHALVSDKLAKEHLKSWWKYFMKWGLRSAPVLNNKHYAKD
ncbi:MAG: glycosyltransferase family 2 protein [bacterium]|nr:glycosyltransferase family 2 protein [bacterium]